MYPPPMWTRCIIHSGKLPSTDTEEFTVGARERPEWQVSEVQHASVGPIQHTIHIHLRVIPDRARYEERRSTTTLPDAESNPVCTLVYC